MRKNLLLAVIFLVLQAHGLAAPIPIPWSQAGKDANNDPKILLIPDMHEDYGKTINKGGRLKDTSGKDITVEAGKPNVYQLPLTNGQKDALGNVDRLGLSTKLDRNSPDAPKEKIGYDRQGKWMFSQQVKLPDVKGAGGLIGLAILADDTATISVQEVQPNGNVKIGDFTVSGGALWQPASFGIAPFSLQYDTDYRLEVSYENIVNVKYTASGEVDVDGISVWAFGASAIHDRWHLVAPGGKLQFWAGENTLAGKFSGMSGWPEYQMRKPSTYLGGLLS